jgi:hypothetical protein
MGYNIQPNAPQFKVGNETYALGCFLWTSGIVEDRWTIGLYRLDPTNGWIVVQQYQPPSVLDDFKAKGGRVAYLDWIKQVFNNWFKDMFFPVPPTPSGEPKDEAEARAILTAFVNSLKVTVTNGVPSV